MYKAKVFFALISYCQPNGCLMLLLRVFREIFLPIFMYSKVFWIFFSWILIITCLTLKKCSVPRLQCNFFAYVELSYFSRHPVFELVHANILGTSSLMLQPLLRICKDKYFLQQNCYQVQFIGTRMHTRTHSYTRLQAAYTRTFKDWNISKNVHLIFFRHFQSLWCGTEKYNYNRNSLMGLVIKGPDQSDTINQMIPIAGDFFSFSNL